MKVLFIEPFYGGSHKYFADGLAAHSRHDISLAALPPRFWKWRHSGSALYFAETISAEQARKADAMVVGSMCDLAHLKALRPDLPPALLYVHENQLAYPVSESEEKDYRYGITDLASMLAADGLVFNSRWNLDSFLTECRGLFRRLPDAVPDRLPDTVEARARIIHPGVAVNEIASVASGKKNHAGIPTVIWNHRHEHDKAPDITARVLLRLADDSVDFRIVLLGERYSKSPADFDVLRSRLPERIVFDGYPAREEYIEWLTRGDVALSSAVHENFGIAMVEAMAAGCLPLCPNRLAYPEVVPKELHQCLLWDDEEDYFHLLEELLHAGAPSCDADSVSERILEGIRKYDWSCTAVMMDDLLSDIAT